MNYIYDILVNFNDKPFDFYEWNISDNVSHIRKIPFFRVPCEDLNIIKNYNFKMDLELLKKIENKTEKFTSRDVEKIKYAAIFCDGNDTIVIRFNNDGVSYQRSCLLIDENIEVIDVCARCEIKHLEYKKMSQIIYDNFKTRMQVEKENYLLQTIKRLENKKEIEKLQYLYFECFGKRESSLETIVDNLKQALANDKTKNIMYEFFKLINV